ncbi:TPA: ead/Ea22-like family protein [Klebsiella pneumoniae]|nr:ead/Ea22-like family protein [Klebsiella pneumoniae]HCM6037186.1 ead/Ea22-like family protein [Klebsiella pneumoniae]HCM6388547.1 ead/Ea22-like family protein [Klebsiella pneumoniae]HCM6475793.1 ead/Ea22-like family protein [Klebsiella pneumoniae]HCM6903600.1 ead/Ea22-like family protein [Klebsiella pneumoniae]
MTTDITELAQSLKAAAEKASNGDWVKESGDGWEACCSANDQANGGFIIAHFVGPDAAENREFVQAANPANVLALVEALEYYKSREERVTSLVRDNSKSWDELYRQVEAKGKRNVELVEALESEKRICATWRKTAEANSEKLEKAQQQMTESENRVRKQNRHICELFDDNTALRQLIAELESRTVKLPKPHAHLIWIQAGHAPDDYWDDVAVSHSEKDRCCDGSERYPVYARWEIEEMMSAAGIKVEAE